MNDLLQRMIDGETIAQIAKKDGLTRYEIECRLAKHGIKARDFVGNIKKNRMLALRKEGLSNRQIAAEMGCCATTVRDYIGTQSSRGKSGRITGTSFAVNTLWSVPSLVKRSLNESI